ncbi:leucine-rich repeat domain-containing protein [Candidatus Aquiluna sp. IMCC13023]|uniref:leucine-rich repeat domain-containing protein n=1 Tax=Candidatus Aquiluna sp. IMCC13023 TaxID=1081644 RepID=UPI0003187C88|nr:leucine-rich repeat domain-containing protein [Candidatus Aquiluna sp. IMCC13023]
MLLKSKKLSLIAVLALLGATLVAPPAWAANIVPCSAGGSFEIIGDGVYRGTSCAGHAEIPNGITNIASFLNAKSLTSITFPNSLRTIESFAFDRAGLETVTFAAGSSLKSIGAFAFDRTALRSITIPSSVTSIGNYAFTRSTSLKTVTFAGNAPGTVGTEVFSQVSADAVVNIGGSAEGFGSGTTWKGLTLVRGFAQGPIDCSIRGTFTVTENVVTGNSSCEGAAVIPETVTSIGRNAFDDAIFLTSITIPNSVTSIEESAFAGAVRLVTVTIPNSVTSIEKYAFYRNAGLKTVTFAAGSALRSIGAGAFYRADSLTSITIPGRVTSIEARAFMLSPFLATVTFAAGSALRSIGAGAFEWTNLDSITIPNSVTSIGNYAFYNNSSLNTVTFAAGSALRSIGAGAFENATKLGSITIPNSVTSIGNYAFEDSTSLTSVTFETGSELKSIGKAAFYGVTKLGSIIIPNSVTSIGDFAFYKATSLTSLTFETGSELKSIGMRAFENATKLGSITIPNSVTSIGNYAFKNATSLTSVTFETGSELKSIGQEAFYGVTKLGSITIPNSVTSIGQEAFKNCTSLTSVTFEGKAPTTVGTDAFSSVGNDAVANIGSAATGFGEATTWNGLTIVQAAEISSVDCSAGGSFTITDNVVTGSTDCAGTAIIPNSVTSIGNFAFSNATALTSVTFEAGSVLTSIGDAAFVNATSLTSITIPDSVISIGDAAFVNATSLTSITIPDSVISIGVGAFSGATSLTSITIPDSVTSIGEEAFENATSLASVTFEGNAPGSVGSRAFGNVGADAVANIGSAATGFGEATTWNGLTIVRAEDTTLPTVTPVTGETNAGATLVIKGTNMDRITEVKIGGTVAPITARTTTSVTVTVPAGLAVGDYTISLTTDEATLLAGGVAKVVALAPPTATPVSGDTNAGATLVIKGTNMDRITEVKIGGTVAPITARTTTSVTVTVPAGLAVGDYTISLTTDDATLLAGGVAQVVAGEVKAATNQKVNAGSFNTYVAVYAKGYKGQTLVWKIAGKWFSTILTEDYQVFQRKTIAVGLEVKVDLFIDGERLLAKKVLTR